MSSFFPFSKHLPSFCNQIGLRCFSTMTKKVLVLLGSGAEEMEAVIAIDVLRRAGLQVTVAGIGDLAQVECSRGVKIVPDIPLSHAGKSGPHDVIVMPGGLGGTKEMIASKEVGDLLREQEKSGRIIASICAAPTALKAHNIFLGKSLTSYPAMEKDLVNQYNYKQDIVVVDGNLITSRGPGTAFEFALAIIEKIINRDKAAEVAKGLLLTY